MHKQHLLDIHDNGYHSTKELLSLGFRRREIDQLVIKQRLMHLKQGFYFDATFPRDSYFEFQQNCKHIVFSNETALYLHHQLVEEPRVSITTYRNYHGRFQDVKVYYVAKEKLTLGLSRIISPAGNLVYAYNMERTLCDLVINEGRIELDCVDAIFNKYFLSASESSVRKLLLYAKELNVYEIVKEKAIGNVPIAMVDQRSLQ